MTGAVARRGDPGTSWAAARSLDPEGLRASQRYVLTILQVHGPMTDEALVARAAGNLSPSGARTRRAELVALGAVVDSGDRERTAAGRQAVVWKAAGPAPYHVEGPTLWDLD